mmetsp:Transcript_4521/g.7047  ORF Transcript_4521/g.7047 Transcript_4521/m.7047 type:complete len:121 (-) Transcript_4521:234-596(-)|eukprot:CAMPEP_0178739628 /NCGR_PEP_ID=MMETSP0744-20121128/4159_1 /TAXON_ID=913974 /ORGANISM="Nitzschia punctata, Strain CCMP561" /LENGTH=120 /DNA_ID=CAMNT_0020392349 /DNA_START=23 /DNA_END=385 /DNA_ORIENTATION=-
MAQGSGKLKNNNNSIKSKKKSGGAQKRKAIKATKYAKRKGSGKIENNKGIVAATKAINKKNERIIAAKACTAGTNFFLKDIAEKGKNESQRQTAVRDKKQQKQKSNNISDRLKDQIKKLR